MHLIPEVNRTLVSLWNRCVNCVGGIQEGSVITCIVLAVGWSCYYENLRSAYYITNEVLNQKMFTEDSYHGLCVCSSVIFDSLSLSFSHTTHSCILGNEKERTRLYLYTSALLSFAAIQERKREKEREREREILSLCLCMCACFSFASIQKLEVNLECHVHWSACTIILVHVEFLHHVLNLHACDSVLAVLKIDPLVQVLWAPKFITKVSAQSASHSAFFIFPPHIRHPWNKLEIISPCARSHRQIY